jgi:hypothetical protein
MRSAAQAAHEPTYHGLKIAFKVKRFSNTHSISIPRPALLEEGLGGAGELLRILALGELEARHFARHEDGCGRVQSRSQ